MKFLQRLMLIVVAAFVLSGCDQVPPGFKAKILSSSGYSEEIKNPGKSYLWGTEEFVLLETATATMSVPMSVKMAEGMDLDFSVNFRTRVNGNDKVLNALFNDVRYQTDDKLGKVITLDQVYGVYGADVLKNVSRSVISKYKVEQISENYDKINTDLQAHLRDAMKNSPLEVSNVTLADIKWPKVITEALEKQQERELAIKTEQNQQAIEMVKRTNALALAEADQQIELKKADTLKRQNQIIAEGISPNFLAWQALQVQSKMAENDKAVFVPYEALNQPGMSQRIYNTK